MMAITIRRYRPDDAAALWGVYYSAIHHVATADYSREQVCAWAPDRPFVEHWGFEVERQQSVVVRGVELTNFRMRKSQLTSKW
jgi:hypothetical protein